MQASSDLACWIDVALGDAGWTAALDASAAMLGAPDVALGIAPKPGIPGQVFCSTAASPGFEDACRELLGAYGAEAVQSRATSSGKRLMWAHAPSSARRQVQDVAVFAQWPNEGNSEMLYRVATMAARAVSARHEIHEMRAALALRGASFDQLPFGVAVVDEALYIREPNAVCREIFSRSDGLSVYQDRLACRMPADADAIASAVARTIRNAERKDDQTIRVTRARGAVPYVVKPVVGRGAQRDHCLLLIIDPELSPHLARDARRALSELDICELSAELVASIPERARPN